MRAYDWEHQIDRPLIRPMLISYNDAHGEHSKREIVPISLEGHRTATGVKIAVIHARCAAARARRSFRVDRIEELIDAETGEQIEDVAAWLAAMVPGGYPERQRDVAVGIEPRPAQSEERELQARSGCGLIWWMMAALVIAAVLFLFGIIRF